MNKFLIMSIIVSILLVLSFLNYFLFLISYLLLIPYALITSYKNYGLEKTIKFLVIAILVSYFFEFTGVHFGFPFGKYFYTSGLGYKIFGVPLSIPFMWFAFIAISYETFNSIILAPLFTMLIDFVIDPLLSGKEWIWITKAYNFYYNIPISNFIGWFVVSFLIILMSFKTLKHKSKNLGSSIVYSAIIISFSLKLLLENKLLAFLIGVIIITITILYKYSEIRKNKIKINKIIEDALKQV